MKTWSWFVLSAFGLSVQAGTLVFEGSGTTPVTGDLIDGTKDVALTTNVVEISDLQITAQSGSDRHKLNNTDSSISFGIDDIDATSETEHTTRFDFGEKMILSFNKKVRISEINFVGFSSNAVFMVGITNQPAVVIADADLGSFDTYACDLEIDANHAIEFSVGNTNSVIGLQTIDLEVLDGSGDLILSMERSNDWINVVADFDGLAVTNYVLQTSTNLTSNVWNTVTGSFNTDTNWSFNTTNSVEFFRAAVPE